MHRQRQRAIGAREEGVEAAEAAARAAELIARRGRHLAQRVQGGGGGGRASLQFRELGDLEDETPSDAEQRAAERVAQRAAERAARKAAELEAVAAREAERAAARAAEAKQREEKAQEESKAAQKLAEQMVCRGGWRRCRSTRTTRRAKTKKKFIHLVCTASERTMQRRTVTTKTTHANFAESRATIRGHALGSGSLGQARRRVDRSQRIQTQKKKRTKNPNELHGSVSTQAAGSLKRT